MNILNIIARYPGSSHDSFVWRNCYVKHFLQTQHANGNNCWLFGKFIHIIEIYNYKTKLFGNKFLFHIVFFSIFCFWLFISVSEKILYLVNIFSSIDVIITFVSLFRRFWISIRTVVANSVSQSTAWYAGGIF